MSNDGWGTSWAPSVTWPEASKELKDAATIQLVDSEKMYSYNSKPVIEFPVSERTNKVPTHDSYTNPNCQLYYSCNCGAILDPGTKSFAQLNNVASKAGWKIRFSDVGYIPYCTDCGKGME